MHEIDRLIEAARRAERGFLATVVRTAGSTYRRAGARCVISADGEVTGTISGGCLEKDLLARSDEWMQDLQPKTIIYDATKDDDIVFGLGLGCRGVIEIRVEPFDASHPPHIADVPRTTLAIYGGGLDVEPLARLAEMIGWSVMVCRPRDVHPEQVTTPDVDAIVIMTHNFLYDAALLPKMLASNARYIGLLGPKSRGNELLRDVGTGFSPARVHNPAGLNLGSETPEEIALSIVAEIQSVLSEKDGQPLREHDGPLHAKAGLRRP